MIVDNKIIDEKLEYDSKREGAKISALSSVKIDHFGYLTGEKILPPDPKKVIDPAKFTYSLLLKAFEKQIKSIEDQAEKQIKAIFEEFANERMDEIQRLSKIIILII